MLHSYLVFFGGREVLVQVRDRGPGTGDTRYSVYATWASPLPGETGGKTYSISNAASTLKEALEDVEWWKFDPDNNR